jgi:hypothetical protein
MKRYCLLIVCALLLRICFGQNVGIGTTAPNSKAILEVKSTDKGILFPRLTNAQRDAIVNPPNGLHIFNTDQRCLNYYDSVFQVWNCYCVDDTCKVPTILLSGGCGIDFYNTYGKNYPTAKKISVVIPAGSICGGLNFANYPITSTVKITIVNYGTILGPGGPGGVGASGQVGGPCYLNATAGVSGGAAIFTRATLPLTIENYGLIAGGGGGGGGGGGSAPGQFGGGGGGGAGTDPGTGGSGGGNTLSVPFGGCGSIQPGIAPAGSIATATVGGPGGAGVSGGGTGGAGGGRAQAGSPGTGVNPGAGGAAGKAVSGGGGVGNIVNNHGTGQVLGVVD